MAQIEVVNVSFQYPTGHRAIQDLSLSIDKSEKIAIIGENGAGKTTFARLLNGLLRPTGGDVFINGLNTKAATTAQISRTVGYVFQNPDDQIFNKDVITEILYTLRYFKYTEEEIAKRLTRVKQLIHLDNLLEENPYNLSYSVRKFVTIGAVLANETDIVILDEPTAGQDKVGLDKLEHIINVLNQEGRTLITITHDMEFVVRNFDRVVVLADSRLIADSDKRQIFWNIPVLEKAIAGNPEECLLYKELSFAQIFLQQLDKAGESCRNGIKHCEDKKMKAEIAYNLAYTYFTKKDKLNFDNWALETKKWADAGDRFTQNIDKMKMELNK